MKKSTQKNLNPTEAGKDDVCIWISRKKKKSVSHQEFGALPTNFPSFTKTHASKKETLKTHLGNFSYVKKEWNEQKSRKLKILKDSRSSYFFFFVSLSDKRNFFGFSYFSGFVSKSLWEIFGVRLKADRCFEVNRVGTRFMTFHLVRVFFFEVFNLIVKIDFETSFLWRFLIEKGYACRLEHRQRFMESHSFFPPSVKGKSEESLDCWPPHSHVQTFVRLCPFKNVGNSNF